MQDISVFKGKVLFLNGTSSSGKSSIAKYLQSVIDYPAYHMSIDVFFDLIAPRLWENEDLINREFPNIIRSFHFANAAIAKAGHFVIVDEVLENKPPWHRTITDAYEDVDIVFAGIHCPIEELERREKSREDRRRGLAKRQFEQVHSAIVYDIELDTAKYCAEDCGKMLIDYIKNHKSNAAFGKIKREFLIKEE